MNLAKTPIADSLAHTVGDLQGVSGERIIVLLTDGEDTCDGDPAAVIASLREGTAKVRVNIVGYAIADAGLERTFQRWAKLGGGEYFGVEAEQELAHALSRAVNPAYQVFDETGTAMASGVAGGEPLTLSPGSYRVEAGSRSETVTVSEGKRTTLTLQ